MVYVNASWLERRALSAAHEKTVTGRNDRALSRWNSGVAGDCDVDAIQSERKSPKNTHHKSAVSQPSSTVIRKQFHLVVVAIFLPGMLTDVGMLCVAVTCALVVLVMLEVSGCCSALSGEFKMPVHSLMSHACL